MKIDDIDLKILAELNENAKMSLKELSETLNLSRTPTYERIKKLEEAGIITGYHAKIDYGKLRSQMTVYTQISLQQHQEKHIKHFENVILQLKEVLSCSHISGSNDYLLKIVVDDLEDYRNFISQRLSEIDYLQHVESSFVLKEIKQSYF